MKFKIQISKWTDPYVVRYLWSEAEFETKYLPLSRGSGPSALLSIWTKGRKDRNFAHRVTIYKKHVYYTLGVLAFFFTISALVILESWIS